MKQQPFHTLSSMNYTHLVVKQKMDFRKLEMLLPYSHVYFGSSNRIWSKVVTAERVPLFLIVFIVFLYNLDGIKHSWNYLLHQLHLHSFRHAFRAHLRCRTNGSTHGLRCLVIAPVVLRLCIWLPLFCMIEMKCVNIFPL